MGQNFLSSAGQDGHQVRGVLFDLDGTLYVQPKLRALMALELLTLPFTGPTKASKRLKALQAFRQAQEHLRGLESAGVGRAQLEAAAAASGLSVAEVDAVVSEWMMSRPLKYLQICRAPGLDRMLGVLERRGIRAGVLSDYPAEQKLRALDLAGRFSPVLCATDPEIDAFKPSPRGYLRACEVWNLPPADVLFVGDRIEVDAAGAAAARMPCAIVGRRSTTVALPANCTVFPSFERLSRVFERD